MADQSTPNGQRARKPYHRHYRHWALTIKPMIEFQLCLLRLWADNMESVAQNYEKGPQTANSAIEQQWQQQHAA